MNVSTLVVGVLAIGLLVIQGCGGGACEGIVAGSGRPGRPELLAKKGPTVGGVGCPPNCRTSGKPRGSLGEAPTF